MTDNNTQKSEQKPQEKPLERPAPTEYLIKSDTGKSETRTK